ncbi:MAG: hypothetical protein ACO22U_13555 [bacterium]
MNIKDHVLENLAIYVVCAVLIPAAWLGFMAVMDDRHEKMGTAVESDLREVKREIRQLQTYQRLAPSDLYGPAREVQIAELEDEAEELERKLGQIRE